MRTFSQTHKQSQKQASSSLAQSNTATSGRAYREHPAAASPRFGYDFSRISLYPVAAGAIQAKLAVNKPGDEYEQEADRISDQVMRMFTKPQLQRACACGGTGPKCQTQQPDQQHERLQTRCVESDDLGQTAAPPIVSDVLRSPGQPLDAATREYFEPRFRYDFSRVRVHTNSEAADSVRSVGALAYAVGPDVVFGAGQYQPRSFEGRRLIAHELTHVV